jgi:hypothetical protein
MSAAKRQKMGGIPDFGNAAKWSFDDDEEDMGGGGGGNTTTQASSRGDAKSSLVTLQTMPTPITVAYKDAKFFVPTSIENGQTLMCMEPYKTRTEYTILFPFCYPTLTNRVQLGVSAFRDESSIAGMFSFCGYLYANGSDSMLAHVPGTLLECANPEIVFTQTNGYVRSMPVAEIASARVKETAPEPRLSQQTILANYHAFFGTTRFEKTLACIRRRRDFGTRTSPNIYSHERGRFVIAIGPDLDEDAGPERCTVASVDSKTTTKSIVTTLTLKYGNSTREVTFWQDGAVAFFGSKRVTVRDFARDMLLFIESSKSHGSKGEIYDTFALVGVTMQDATLYAEECHAVVRSVPLMEHLGDIAKRLVSDENVGDRNRRPPPRCEYALKEGSGRSVPLMACNSVSAMDEIVIPCPPIMKVLRRLANDAVGNKSWPVSYVPFIKSLTPELVKEIIEKIDTDLAAMSPTGKDNEADDVDTADYVGAMSGDEDDDGGGVDTAESSTPTLSPIRRLMESYKIAMQNASSDEKEFTVQRIGLVTTLLFEFPSASDFIWRSARMGIRRRPTETDTGDEDGGSVNGAHSDTDDD